MVPVQTLTQVLFVALVIGEDAPPPGMRAARCRVPAELWQQLLGWAEGSRAGWPQPTAIGSPALHKPHGATQEQMDGTGDPSRRMLS